ncbi:MULTISPECIES: hypothetical protein [unclassified Microcoleus]|uniref:hypothetical protein n=1 Tax=unclassified Microcoleus TaxID=2642155 RepID=UPI002FD426A0
MADIRKLLNQVAAQETQLRDTQFLAPCVRGGRVRTRVAGMVYTFKPKPRNFEGWGIFQPVNEKIAEVVEEASLPQLTEYLQLLVPIRLQLICALQSQTWLAYPVNESDVRQRIGVVKPVPVHLVTDGASFEPIVARWDGQSWWFEDIDRRADPLPSEELRTALKKVISPQEIRFKGMTPEMRTVYELVAQQTEEFSEKFQQRRDESRLREALQMGGGELREFRDRDNYWLIEWTAGNGDRHTSAIAKNDLTVVSAGICLSGLDRNFDLQSLVGVIEAR